jgi:hypothetical protein
VNTWQDLWAALVVSDGVDRRRRSADVVMPGGLVAGSPDVLAKLGGRPTSILVDDGPITYATRGMPEPQFEGIDSPMDDRVTSRFDPIGHNSLAPYVLSASFDFDRSANSVMLADGEPRRMFVGPEHRRKG